ncbi:MAG: metallophosphoesterase [Saprospiraceae bacterium]|nr:metallophosphoesterase [Saprospiraceae bacterium]
MKIIQLTDLHIGMEDEETNGIDIRKNFLFILDQIRKEQPDQLIITGDLCLMNGRVLTYQWIGQQLENFPCPVNFLSGNHDQATILAKHLGKESFLQGTELYGRLDWEHGAVLFLDTSPGRMSQPQKDWLRNELAQSSHPRIIFMHHPPALAGLPFMDNNHPFHEARELQEIFQQAPYPCTVFCGHYHIECTIQLPNLTIFITPSIYFQIDGNYAEFQVDHTRIAYRKIEWASDHSIRCGLKYFDGFKID